MTAVVTEGGGRSYTVELIVRPLTVWVVVVLEVLLLVVLVVLVELELGVVRLLPYEIS